MNNEKDVKDTGIVSQESINRAIEEWIVLYYNCL